MFATTKGKVCIGRVCVCEGETVLQDGQYFMKLFAPRLLLPLLGVCTLVGACLVLSLLHGATDAAAFPPTFLLVPVIHPISLSTNEPSGPPATDPPNAGLPCLLRRLLLLPSPIYRRSLVGFLGWRWNGGETGYIGQHGKQKKVISTFSVYELLPHSPTGNPFFPPLPAHKTLEECSIVNGQWALVECFLFASLSPL